MNKTMKYGLIFVIVLFLSLGIINASEITDDNLDSTEISQSIPKELSTTKQCEVVSEINNQNNQLNTTTEKSIISKNTSKITQSSKKESSNTIILNSTSFNNYVTNGKFNDNVNPGDTIDVHGLLDGTFFNLTVNKAVNITSTTHDARWGAESGLKFEITKEGSGTNVSNINFYQTRIFISNTTGINIDNITNTVTTYFQGSINNIDELSCNIRITNSYFYSEQVGTWSCNFKVSGVEGLLVENCTFIEVGYCMNNVYLQIAYNIAEEHKKNNNITFRNCMIDGSNAVSQAASCGLVMQGSNILIENCTIKHNSTDTYAGENYIVMGVWIDLNYGTGAEGENIATDLVDSLVFRNNIIEGDSIEGGEAIFSSFKDAKVYNNTIRNVTTWVGNQEVYNNTFDDIKILKENTTFTNNVIKGNLNVSNGSIVKNNIMLGITNITGINNTFENNLINNLIVKDYEQNSIANNTQICLITDETISDYQLISNQLVISNLTDNSEVFINLKRNDIKILNITSSLSNVNFTIIDTELYHVIISPESTNVNFINCNCPKTSIEVNNTHTIINSTFLGDVHSQYGTYIDSIIINQTAKINTITANSTIDKDNSYERYFDNMGMLLDDVEENSVLIIRNTPLINSQMKAYDKSIIINKPINITTFDDATWNSNITFIKGSEGSIITNLHINANINIFTDSINLINNTITEKITINSSNNNIIRNNVIGNSYIDLKNSSNNKIYNNSINTTNDYTIEIDSSSHENEIIKNLLISPNRENKHSIKQENIENTIINNTPKYDSNITITLINSTCINDTEIPVNISVNFENETIAGNLILLFDGVEIENIKLDGKYYTTKIKLETLGIHNIKTYFYPEDLYENISTQQNITVKKITTNMDITYNQTKILENTTVIAYVTDEYGNKVSEGQVTFTLSEKNIIKTVNNGTVTITFLTKEEYSGQTLTATYEGTPSRTNVTTKTTLNTLKGDSFVSLRQETAGGQTTIIARVTNKNGETITGGYIQFVSPSISKLVKIVGAETNITITTPTEDTTITASFRNNPNYENSNNTLTLYNKKDSAIFLNSLENITVGETFTINGNLSDSAGNSINNEDIKIAINDVEYQTNTDNNGVFLLSTTATQGGTNTIIISYDGNEKYNPTFTNVSIDVRKKTTSFLYYNIKDLNVGEIARISAKLLCDNQPVKAQTVIVKINDEEFNVRTSSTGFFAFDYTASIAGLNNITFSYGGNGEYGGVVNVSSFNVIGQKDPTTFLYYNIKDVNMGETVKISAKLLSDNQPVKGQTVTVMVNDEVFVVKTSSTGFFALNYVAGIAGVNNITFIYGGNDDYNEVTNSSSFNVVGNKKNVSFIYYNINDVNVGDSVKVSAKLLCDGQPVKSQKVTLKINNEDIIVKTSSTGYFAFDYTTKTVGLNNITFVYDGNSEYEAVTNTSSFNVVGNKKDVTFLYYGIKDVNVGDNVKVSAKLLCDGQPVKGQIVTVMVNDDVFVVKTSSTGYFVIEYTTNAVGVNNITFTYAGNSEYNQVTNVSAFNVIGQKDSTSFLYYKIKDVKVGDNVKVSAKLLCDNQPVKGQKVTVTVNGEEFVVKTSSTGYFAFDYICNFVGINNITFTYNGNEYYLAVTNSTQFTCII